MTNPFAPTTNLPNERGVFADGATRRQAGFVYRVIEFTDPFVGELIYDGWWFRQQVSIDGRTLWRRISWARFYKQIDFHLPPEIDNAERPVRIDIQFGLGLSIRRFQVSVAGMIAYDEIA
jgi:hypothetical protein